MEVAQMLYTVEPFRGKLGGQPWRWKSLARQASDFLDNAHEGLRGNYQKATGENAAYDHRDALVQATEHCQMLCRTTER